MIKYNKYKITYEVNAFINVINTESKEIYNVNTNIILKV